MDFYAFRNLVTCLITSLAFCPGRATAAAPLGRQDFLIPRAWNQLFRFPADAPPSYIEVWRTRLSPAISRRRWTRARCHHAKSPVCSTAGGARWGGVAHTDKGERIERPRMHICKTNSPKSREIYHLCFLVPVQTERPALCNLAESSSTLRSKRGLLDLKKGANILSRNWSDLPRSTQLLEARVSAVERDSKAINTAWPFSHSVPRWCAQHPACSADTCFSYSLRLRVRQSSRRLGWESRHFISRICRYV